LANVLGGQPVDTIYAAVGLFLVNSGHELLK